MDEHTTGELCKGVTINNFSCGQVVITQSEDEIYKKCFLKTIELRDSALV
jgi:hypothetical protein